MLDIDYLIEINIDDIEDDLIHAHEKSLEDVADFLVKKAKDLAPVDTGFLRDSIISILYEESVEVLAEADYAVFVELGTQYAAAQPFLIAALYQNRKECLDIYNKSIQEVLK